MLGVLAEDIAALRARLADKKKALAVAKQEASAGKPKSPAKMRATALKDLDAVQKRELLKTIVRRVELTRGAGRYCGLDTWGMVLLLRRLRRLT